MGKVDESQTLCDWSRLHCLMTLTHEVMMCCHRDQGHWFVEGFLVLVG